MPNWPATLPVPLVDGASYTPQDNSIRTQMAAGTAKVRRRFTAVPETFGFTLRLTRAQVQALDAFVITELKDVLTFDWTNFRLPAATVPPVQSALTTATTGGTLPASTTYFYVISAIGPSGESLRSNERSITTGLGATNSIVVSWAAVTGATSYTFYRGTATGAQNLKWEGTTGLAITNTVVNLPAGLPRVLATDRADYRFVKRPSYSAVSGATQMWDASIELERLP